MWYRYVLVVVVFLKNFGLFGNMGFCLDWVFICDMIVEF